MTLKPHPFETLFELKTPRANCSEVTVVIPCYKYGREALEALDSLKNQTESVLDIVLIDDMSPDDSVQTVHTWFVSNARHPGFGHLRMVRHLENQGLSASRNTAISLVRTRYTFMLDADNMIYPRAIARLRQAIEASGMPMAYSLLERFGKERGIIGNSIWIPNLFSRGNYVDAMVLLMTTLLHEMGGYRIMPYKFGWEDYDMWCSMVDHGYEGCHVPEILCRYRVHENSMLLDVTNKIFLERFEEIKADFEAHHDMKFDWDDIRLSLLKHQMGNPADTITETTRRSR
ncbi:MAG TPA: glycosyltransferase family 2 protein [bacterium]|nr:glycosyltransferase family 2 protein [bacterium]